MTYTKLFGSILDSTVWGEPSGTRLTWITLLAMADQHGCIWASVPGLAKRAGVTRKECETALASFAAPDPDSRTQDYEGRRIEAIDGGWLLLNHGKFRDLLSLEDRRTKAAERQRRFKARAKSNAQVTQSNVGNDIRSDQTRPEQDHRSEETPAAPSAAQAVDRPSRPEAPSKPEQPSNPERPASPEKPSRPKKPKAETSPEAKQLHQAARSLMDFYREAWVVQRAPVDGKPPGINGGDVQAARKWVTQHGLAPCCVWVNRYLRDESCLGAKNGWPLRQMPVDAYRSAAPTKATQGWARPMANFEGTEAIDATARVRPPTQLEGTEAIDLTHRLRMVKP